MKNHPKQQLIVDGQQHQLVLNFHINDTAHSKVITQQIDLFNISVNCQSTVHDKLPNSVINLN